MQTNCTTIKIFHWLMALIFILGASPTLVAQAASGAGPAASAVPAAPAAPDAATLTFQYGSNSYTGTVDTYIDHDHQTSSYGTSTSLYWWNDTTYNNDDQIALVRFDDMFGSGVNQIPVGSTITAATLSYTFNDTGSNATMYESLVDWSGSTTWNSFGGDAGVDASEYYSSPTYTAPGSGTVSVDVLTSLQAWASGSRVNRGWIFISTGNNNVRINSSEFSTVASRPSLTVTYTPSGAAPNQPELVQPADGGTGVSTSPTLEVTVSDPDADPLDVTFYGRKKSAAEGDFTLAVLPDTQNYTAWYPGNFTAQTQWIVNNRASSNIVYVAHVGDIVGLATSTSEWQVASDAMALLENPVTTGLPDGIPYGVIPGNHDEDSIYGTASYNATFGVSRFAGRSYFGGEYPSGDMQNNFMLFSASGMDFIVIDLDYLNWDAGVLDWADALLKTYASRRAIIVRHDILFTTGDFSNEGYLIYESLKDNPNLFLMLSGHYYIVGDGGEAHRSDTYQGNTVYTVMANYQERENGGNGWLRLMQFSPASDTISIKTYSPTLDQYETDADSQFTLPYDMVSSNPFVELGTVSGVSSGANASITWSGLAPSTEYEWYARASDGTATTDSLTWSFTTASPACYLLTIGHSGQGSDPVAAPTSSEGCAYHQYLAGAAISLKAYQAAGWHIGGWTGTNNDGSTAATNTVTMPAAARSVSVNYVQNSPPEYSLTITTVGDGSVNRSPDQSTYADGSTVQLTAIPDTDWTFAGWSGDLSEYDYVVGEDLSIVSNGAAVENHLLKNVIDDATEDYARKNFTLGSTSNSLHYSFYFDLNDLSLPYVADELKIFAITNNNAYSEYLAQSYVLIRKCDVHDSLELLVRVQKDNGDYADVGWYQINGAPHTLDVEIFRESADGYANGSMTVNLDGVQLGSISGLDNFNVFQTIDGLQVGTKVISAASTTLGTIFFDDIVVKDGSTEIVRLSHEEAGLTGVENPASITIHGNRRITASFYQNPTCYELTLTHTGAGSNPVPAPAKSPGCLADGQFVPGTTITLTAMPDSGAEVESWSGTHNNTSTATTNKVTMPFGAHTASVTYTQGDFALTITSAHGAVVKDPDQATYHYGDVVELTATADPGWTFSGWSGGLVSTDNPASLTITGTMSVTANYTQNEYALTITSAHGMVAKDPDQATYHYGDVVELTATADPGWTFSGWSGGLVSTSNPASLTITGATSVTANYTQNEYALTITSAHGTVAKDPDQATYHYGDVVELTATADPGWTFSGWSGGLVSTDNPASLTITGATSVTANYTQNEYALTITSAHGAVAKDPNQATYHYGDVVELTATADPGWTFFDWSGGLVSTDNPASLTITGATSVTANYTQDEYTLTITSAHGTVAKDPDQATYHYGDVVELTATADPGWTFTDWSGDLISADNPASLTITGTMSVAANYTQDEYTLTIIAVHGTVEVDNPGPYVYGDVVELAATADPGWTFVGWSGDLAGTDNPMSITITGNMSVTADFTQDEYTLDVTSAHGTVARDPDQATYHYGDVVELAATADPGWTFVGWSGDLSGADNPASLTITGNTSVTANFTQDEYTLDVASLHGTVTKDPDQATYHYGDVVQLTSNPGMGWQFTGWSGDLNGSENPASLTITGDMSVTANYTQTEYKVTITVLGYGSVSLAPSQATYHYGDVIHMEAVPDFGSEFMRWSGDISETEEECQVTVTGDMTITATFTQGRIFLPVVVK